MNRPVKIVRHEIAYAPRPLFLPYHNRRQRWAIIVAHRRAGKTVSTINDKIKRAVVERKPDGRYAFIMPLRSQVKDTAWPYLKRFAAPILAEPPNESELWVRLFGGALIRLYGGDNPDALRGPYLDGATLDEFGDMRPSLWYEVIRPMLADRHGWATFIGTPKGKNAFFDLWEVARRKPEEWFHAMFKASETGIINAAELVDMKSEMGEDRYAAEMECSFEAAIKGAFYAREMQTMLAEGRIGSIEVEPGARVHTSWDLGVSDSTAIWFWQAIGRERRAIDYYETSGVGLDHYKTVLIEKAAKRGFEYGDHYLPHDIDQRELSSGQSRKRTLETLIPGTVIAVRQHHVLDGINAVRKMLGRTWIDDRFCARGIESLRQYVREWDDRLKDWKANPFHNWASHGADAARSFAAGFDDPLAVKEIKPKRRYEAEPRGGSEWSA